MIDLLSFAMLCSGTLGVLIFNFPNESFIGKGVIALSTINIILITYLSRNELTNQMQQENYASSTHF